MENFQPMRSLIWLVIFLQGCAVELQGEVAEPSELCDKPVYLLLDDEPDLSCIKQRASTDKDAAERFASHLYWRDRKLTDEVAFWYEKSIQLGSERGVLNYAASLKAVNSEKYLSVLKLGAELGIANAQYNLALYLIEQGIDEGGSLKFLRAAGQQCHVPAIFMLVEQLIHSAPDEASIWLIWGLSLSYSNALEFGNKLELADSLKEHFSVEKYVSFIKDNKCYVDKDNPFRHFQKPFIR